MDKHDDVMLEIVNFENDDDDYEISETIYFYKQIEKKLDDILKKIKDRKRMN